MKKTVSILLLLVMIFTLVACNGNKELVGKWNLNEAELVGMEIIMTITDDQLEVLGEFYDYKVKGDKIVVENDGQEVEVAFEVDGDTLTFGSGDEIQIYTRVEE